MENSVAALQIIKNKLPYAMTLEFVNPFAFFLELNPQCNIDGSLGSH